MPSKFLLKDIGCDGKKGLKSGRETFIKPYFGDYIKWQNHFLNTAIEDK